MSDKASTLPDPRHVHLADSGGGVLTRGVAGIPQAIVLLAATTLPIMGIVSLAPVLPLLERHFATTPGHSLLVPVALTIPGLMIAFLSPVAGWIADRVGRRLLLLVALAFYALFGLAPLFLDTLAGIIVSRAGLGITEAAIMTVSAALTGDYFSGGERRKWIAYQAGAGSIIATMLFIIGGALGDVSWRAPFLLYVLALPVLLAAYIFVWEPITSGTAASDKQPVYPFPWRMLGIISAATIFCALMFYSVPLHVGVILAAHGMNSSAVAGLATGIGSLGVPLGAFLFGRYGQRSVAILLSTSLALCAVGLIAVSFAASLPAIIAALALQQLGSGLLLPTLIGWCLGQFPLTLRGRGMGIWQSAFFVGQFLCPLSVALLTMAFAGVGPAMLTLGIASAVGAAFFYLVRNSTSVALPPIVADNP